MESIFFVVGSLVLVTGFFLAVAMSIHFCACFRIVRRIRREKARLREIRLAAAESPPPYAIAVLACQPHRQQSDNNCQSQEQPCCQSWIHDNDSPYTISSAHVNEHGSNQPVVPSLSRQLRRQKSYSLPTLHSNQATVHCYCLSSGPPPSYEEALKIENAAMKV